MDFVCPSCKSDNIQRLSVIYEGGLLNINTKSKGTAVGFGSGGIGVGIGGSKTTGTTQTAASQRAAPPEKMTYLRPLAVIFFMELLLSWYLSNKGDFVNIVATIAWLAASAGWIYFAFQYNAKKWPPLKAAWDNSYLCNRCNEIFHLRNS